MAAYIWCIMCVYILKMYIFIEGSLSSLPFFNRISSVCFSLMILPSYIQVIYPWPEYYQFSSVAQLCLTLCNPRDCSTPGFPVHHQLPELTQTHSIESVMPSNHLILCRPLLLLPSVFPSIRVFSNESVLHIRCPKYLSHIL